MNEKDFFLTLKEYLAEEGHFDILELINPCKLSFNYTSVFASKNYQYRAYVDIRVPVSKLKELKEHISILSKLSKDIFIEDEEYALYGVDIKPMLISSKNNDDKNISEDIENRTADTKINDVEFREIIISNKIAECLAQTICGDNQKSFYRKGYELVQFFNQFGFEDVYEIGFPSRIIYAREKIQLLNKQKRLSEVIETLLDPREYIDREYDIKDVANYLNQYLQYDKLIVKEEDGFFKLQELKKNDVLIKESVTSIQKTVSDRVINENKKPVVFFSYSHKDEELRNELEKHLIMLKRKGIIETWHDRVILAGSELTNEIDKNLQNADIILLLVSIDFLASDYCYDIEMKKALEMHANNEATVIPVILRNCDWHSAPFGKLMAVPIDGKGIVTWSDRDSAFLNVAKSIEAVALKIIQ